MKKYTVKFSPKSEKELSSFPRKDIQKILKAIISLELDPYLGKKLKGHFDGFFSMRVWPYRVIYSIIDKECIVVIIRIGHRKNVYR